VAETDGTFLFGKRARRRPEPQKGMLGSREQGTADVEDARVQGAHDSSLATGGANREARKRGSLRAARRPAREKPLERQKLKRGSASDSL
jgi:hypothetical protein